MKGILSLLCCSLIFFSIAQPAVIFPSTEPYRIFFILAGLAIILFIANIISTNKKLITLAQNKFYIAILITYTLSKAQYFWLPGTIDTFLFWFKKIILYFLIINIITDFKDYKRLVWCVVLATIVITFKGWDLYLYHPELLTSPNRFESVGNYNLSNSFALLMTLVFPLTFSLMEVEKSIIKKSVLIIVMFLFVLSCLYTKSRGGSIGMLIAILLCVLLSRRLFRSNIAKIAIMGILIISFLGIGVSIIMSRPDVKHYYGGDTSAGDRRLVWRAAVKMSIDHPIFGVGYGKFTEYVRDYGHNRSIIAHNTPLSVLAETGIFGLIFFLWIIWITLKQLFKMRQFWCQREDRLEPYILAQGVIISIICFLINSSFSVKDHEPMYWALLYFGGVLCSIYQNENLEKTN